MRPVRLEMDGFASFRAATVVDFADADYFALVGPTGSGKSTVIDALVFALYGTAPRWDRANAIQYALAPTSTRATVRLVFDVGPQRYQIAREVRRVGRGGQVQQKGAFLERFLDATADSADSDEVQVLASELREVKGAVEQLIGLSFEDFTQAVVLPQGKFADFLSAKGSERQAILLKLLGADQYDRIRAAAGERSRLAAAQVAGLDARLAEGSDLTPELQADAEARVVELDALRGDVDVRVSALSSLRDAARAASEAREAAAGRVARLEAVRTPDAVGDLAERSEAVRRELDAARAAEAEAADAMQAARAALTEAGPRSGWERLAALWAESAALAGTLPGLREAAAAAGETLQRAAAARERAGEALEAARRAAGRAEEAARAAADAVTRAEERRGVLAAASAPTDQADLSARAAAADADLARADAALADAEAADSAARAAASEAGDGSAARRSLERLAQRTALTTELAALTGARGAAEAAASAPKPELEAAAAAVHDAEEALHAARAANSAAELRAHVAVGDACPVCDRTIDAPPTVLAAADTAPAQRALDAARERLRQAQTTHRSADREAATAGARATGAADRLGEVERALAADHPGADLDALEGPLREAVEGCARARRLADEAATRLATARTGQRAAATAREELKEAVASGWRRFRETRAPLLPLGHPLEEPDGLGDAWEALTRWVAGQAAMLDEDDLPRLRAARDDAGAALAEATAAAERALTARRTADAEATASVQGETAASGDVARAEARQHELEATLRDEPDADAVAAALARVAEAEAAAKASTEGFDAAREEQRRASEADAAMRQQTHEARETLRVTRDELAPLGAPSIDPGDLRAGWSTLADWAGGALEAQRAELDRAEAGRAAAERAITEAEEALVGVAQQHGVPVASAAQVVGDVAEHLAEARTLVRSIEAALKGQAQLIAQRTAAEEEQSVAALLEKSLRANNFQEWLAGAALDMLVAAASETLHTLSGGQFGLTHERGEFFVIDHADAEATRSVRTLSGGETFQTSLALALALSEQLSSLSTTAAKLESLFLDEGFGTLDADSLETVALTLEQLAQGDRMVGVVTHVPSLAERVPTRFEVTRDSQSSRVERKG